MRFHFKKTDNSNPITLLTNQPNTNKNLNSGFSSREIFCYINKISVKRKLLHRIPLKRQIPDGGEDNFPICSQEGFLHVHEKHD